MSSINFIVFDGTGRITRSGFCGSESMSLQANPGETAMVSPAPPGGGYVESGVVIPFPPKPSPSHAFNYATKQWEPDSALAIDQVQAQRARLLQESDWTALPDVPMDAGDRALWTAYRQALRDVTAQAGYPLTVIWPVKP